MTVQSVLETLDRLVSLQSEVGQGGPLSSALAKMAAHWEVPAEVIATGEPLRVAASIPESGGDVSRVHEASEPKDAKETRTEEEKSND